MERKIKAFVCGIVYSPYFDKIYTLLGGARLFAECRLFIEKRRLLKNAKREFGKGSCLGSLIDYKEALKKHWFSFSEYAYEYELYKKSEEERNEFVSRLKMAYFYWRYVPGFTKPVFRDKQKFLNVFNNYIHREWLYVPEASLIEFEQLVSNYDCIVKPCDDKQGHGIFKIKKDDYRQNQDKIIELYMSCKNKRMLVEQCIESCEELKAIHPQSLNTIRVVTVSNRNRAEVFGSVIRMGTGNSVIDNAHAGGLFAQINVENGEIESDGLDLKGNRHIYHPDSKIVFKGFKIPRWDFIVNTCCEAAKMVENTLTGWDVVINNKGDLEFVEGNNGPGFGFMQSPLQVGVKKRIFAKIMEYRGIEMK